MVLATVEAQVFLGVIGAIFATIGVLMWVKSVGTSSLARRDFVSLRAALCFAGAFFGWQA